MWWQPKGDLRPYPVGNENKLISTSAPHKDKVSSKKGNYNLRPPKPRKYQLKEKANVSRGQARAGPWLNGATALILKQQLSVMQSQGVGGANPFFQTSQVIQQSQFKAGQQGEQDEEDQSQQLSQQDTSDQACIADLMDRMNTFMDQIARLNSTIEKLVADLTAERAQNRELQKQLLEAETTTANLIKKNKYDEMKSARKASKKTAEPAEDLCQSYSPEQVINTKAIVPYIQCANQYDVLNDNFDDEEGEGDDEHMITSPNKNDPRQEENFPVLVEKQVRWKKAVKPTTDVARKGQQERTATKPNDSRKTPPPKPTTNRSPPIIVDGHVTSSLAQLLKKETKNWTMETKKRTTVIKPTDTDAHEKILKIVKAQHIEAYTYTSGVNSTTYRIIKGVHHSYTAVELEDEIEALSGIKVAASAMTMRREENEMKLNMFRIRTDTPEAMNKVAELKYVLNQRVYFDLPRKNDVIQCYRCQRYGHVSSNCHMKPKCVKCEVHHEAGQCKRGERNETPPYCVNCEEFGHPANYKGCPKRKSIVENLRLTRKAKDALAAEKQKNFIESAGRTVSPNMSYAEQVKKKTDELRRTGKMNHNSQVPKSSPFNNNFALSDKLPALCEEINSQIPKFKLCKTFEEQQTFITLFLFNKISQDNQNE